MTTAPSAKTINKYSGIVRDKYYDKSTRECQEALDLLIDQISKSKKTEATKKAEAICLAKMILRKTT